MTIEEANHICGEKYVDDFFSSLKDAYSDMKDNLGIEAANVGFDRCVSNLVDDYLKARVGGFISHEEFASLLGEIRNRGISPRESGFTASIDSIEGTEGVKFRVGCLVEPKEIDKMPELQAKVCFKAPATIDLRDYCGKTSNQGNKPWCAAYAAAGFATNVVWRKVDMPITYDCEAIYSCAKAIDGAPSVDGTSLDAVLKYFLHEGIFDSNQCSIKMLRNILQIKYAIHKFGCCLVGVNVSEEWYYCNKGKSTISGKTHNTLLGGHAVLACGYNRDGLIIQNSWDVNWGKYGFALITWDEFEREFVYGAVIDNCLYNTKMN